MGRGRAKAKQTKVARELKYRTGGTDLQALQAELTGNGHHDSAPPSVDGDGEDDDEPYGANSPYDRDGSYDDDSEDDWLPAPRSS